MMKTTNYFGYDIALLYTEEEQPQTRPVPSPQPQPPMPLVKAATNYVPLETKLESEETRQRRGVHPETKH